MLGRIGLFLMTNLAIIVMASIAMMVLSMLGVNVSSFGPGGQQMGGLLVMCVIWGMAGSFVSLLLSKWLAKKSTGTKVIDAPLNDTERWLLDVVARQAQEVGIKMPEVGIFDSPQPNAFATGWNKNAALVAVSTGLLRNMGHKEVEAVLAHEVGHVANGDMVTLALIQGVVNAFVMFFARIIGNFVDRAIFKNESEGPGIAYFVTSVVMDFVLGFLGSAIVMWFSRKREFRADEMGARLAGREHMIAALNALRPVEQRPAAMPENMQAFAIATGKRDGFSAAALFASHPSLDDRIEALRRLP